MKSVPISTIAISLLGIASAVLVPPAARDSAEYLDFRARMRAMPIHKRGYFHLADDGVARSMGPNNEVLGFAAASPAVLSRWAADGPEEQRAHLEEVWDGVDGRDVADPWVIKRKLISPSKRGVTGRRDVLDAGDIVIRSLLVPLHKRSCFTSGMNCQQANPDCINFEHPEDDCICNFTDEAHFGQCLAN